MHCVYHVRSMSRGNKNLIESQSRFRGHSTTIRGPKFNQLWPPLEWTSVEIYMYWFHLPWCKNFNDPLRWLKKYSIYKRNLRIRRNIYGTENEIWDGFNRLAILIKKWGPIMSNFGGFFFQGQKKNLIFLKYCSIRTKKLPQMKVRKPKKYIFDI